MLVHEGRYLMCPTGMPRQLSPAAARESTARRRTAWIVMAAFCLLSVCARAAGTPDGLGRVERVADGDTITVSIDGERARVRLHQIDAPEMDQPGASEARRALAEKVDGRLVRLHVETVDDYGRLVADVYLGERDINRELVREGHAWAYRRYLRDRSLLDDEATARQGGLGLWGLPDPVAPWDWRQARREGRTGASAPSGCAIKGNISRRGERIYHVPGDRHYDRTRIDTSRGERWFCSEAGARRAGWRHARSR
jgi:endonuclease YncB( thermonuclease family)